MDELIRIFKRWNHRYRLQRGIHWSGTGLVFGLSLGIGLSLVAISQQKILRHEFITMTAGIGIFIAVFIFLAGYFWQLSNEKVVQMLDRIFGLQERVSTAFELHSNVVPLIIPQEIVGYQLQDALEQARRINPNHKLPLSINRTQGYLVILLILATVFISVRGEQYFQAALTQRVVQQAITQEIEQIEVLRTQMETDPRLTIEQQQVLTQLLEEAQEGLENALDAEQAMSVLTSAQEKLMALRDAQEQGEVLREIGKSISQQDGSPLQGVGEQLASGNYLAAAQELENIDLNALSDQDQQNLVEQLQDAAEELDSTNPKLAGQMRQAAESLQQGDMQASYQALQDAAQTLANAGQEIVMSEVVSQAANQIGQSKAQILQAGQTASGQISQSGQQNYSEGSGSSQGQDADNQGGSGSGRGEGDNSDQSSEVGSQPIDQGNSPGDGGEQSYEQIYTPIRLGGVSDTLITLPESEDIGEQIVGTDDTSPGERGSSSVPYVDAYTYYAEFYWQAMNSGQVPTALREFVWQYFMSLEP